MKTTMTTSEAVELYAAALRLAQDAWQRSNEASEAARAAREAAGEADRALRYAESDLRATLLQQVPDVLMVRKP